MTKIMVLNGSFRPHGFTDSLIRSFKAGAESRGHEVTVFPLRAMDIHPCVGCLHGGRDTARPCTQSDDMDRIYDTYREMDRLWALAEGRDDQLHGNGKSGALLVAVGGSHPQPILDHFDYLMKRLEWTNLGKVVLTHTDDMDMDHIPTNQEAFQLGAGVE